jgi:hypothetical protein
MASGDSVAAAAGLAGAVDADAGAGLADAGAGLADGAGVAAGGLLGLELEQPLATMATAARNAMTDR